MKPVPDKYDAILVIKGLLEIAECAMPDTFYNEDSRVIRAKRLLKKLEKKV